MDDALKTGKTFDAIAEHFDKTRNRPWKEVIKFLEEGKGRLLDMGCGNGRHSKVAMDLGYRVVGLDASGELLKICKGKPIEAHWVQGDVKTLPFNSHSFDRLICIAVIHHLRDLRVEALKEMRRVLNIGGKILISVWARELERWDLEENERDTMVPWHREDGTIIDRFYHLYTLDELVNDVEMGGFTVTYKYRSGGNNYVEACR